MYIHFYAFIYDCVLFNGLTPVYTSGCEIELIQSNFNGTNTFGTMKISSRQG